MTKARRMRELLQGDELIVSPGVFDGYSVRLVEQAGFKTASTSGAAVANSRFSQPDVGIMGMLDNASAVAHLARSVSIPLMADADTGYGNAVTVHHAVRYFEEAGVVGINLEDQVWPKRCGHMEGKQIIDADEMAKKLEAACNARQDDDFVIVARTDAIAIGGIDEAVRRAKLYEAAGADVLFPDAVRNEDDIKALRDAIDIPLTVNMGFGIRSRPTTPLIPLPRLKELGVKRVSLPRMLPAAAMQAMKQALSLMKQSMESGETMDRPDLLFGIDDIMELMDYRTIRDLEARYTLSA